MEFEPDKCIINSLLDINMYIMYNLDHKSLSVYVQCIIHEGIHVHV